MAHRQAIFIFGMGRSGTSALARVLSLCGAWLPEQLLGANDGNPKGHWEPLEALHLNDAFLSAHGSSFWDPSLRLQDAGSVDEADTAAFIEKIGAFLASLPHGRPSVIKEPRIVALADFWFEAARRSSIDIAIIIPVRHPGEVAASLAKRDQASVELSNALWLKNNLLAERCSRTFPRVFVEYSSLLADWHTQIARISDALSVRFDNRDDEAIREFLTHDLHRQRHSELTEAFGASWVSEVYGAFSAAAGGARLDTDKLDEIFASYSASERTFRTASNEFRNRYPGYHWASDLKPFLARVVDECSADISRRFGDAVPPDAMPVDPIRTPFHHQADRVSVALESLAAHSTQLQEAYATLAAEGARLQDAYSRLAADEAQLQEAAATLAARDIELQRARADLSAHQRASQDREDALRAQRDALQRDAFAQQEQLDALAATAARSQATIAQLVSLISALRTHIETFERSHSWRLTAPFRAIRRGRRGVSPLTSLDVAISALRLRAEREAASVLPGGFDRDAYLTLNPDVAESGVDPVYHYLAHGRSEGRAYTRSDVELRVRTAAEPA